MERADWSYAECYFAVWGYDQLDQNRSTVKAELFRYISSLTGRNMSAVENKIENVSSFDTRPRELKPISAYTHAQKLLREVYDWYQKDPQKGRAQFPVFLEALKQGSRISPKEVEKKRIIVEEGSEYSTNSTKRKRSHELTEYAREYFSKSGDEDLKCICCGYVKPKEVITNIIEIHHKELISEVDPSGRRIPMSEAVKGVVPLCPNCHRIAHSTKPPLNVDTIRRLVTS